MDSNLLYDKYFALLESKSKNKVVNNITQKRGAAYNQLINQQTQKKQPAQAPQTQDTTVKEDKKEQEKIDPTQTKDTTVEEDKKEQEPEQEKIDPTQTDEGKETDGRTENTTSDSSVETSTATSGPEQPVEDPELTNQLNKQREDLKSILSTVSNVIDKQSFTQAKTAGQKSAAAMFPKQWKFLNDNYPKFAETLAAVSKNQTDINDINAIIQKLSK